MPATTSRARRLVPWLVVATLAIAAAAATAVVKAAAPSPSDLLAVGTPAPAFTATAHTGDKVDLAKLRGRWVVLYFYPMDDTSGCTKEACDFRDSWARLQADGVAVYGVSTQGNSSHQAFAQKNKLPFPLIPDEKGELAAKYKVPVNFGVAHRVTYLIGKDGTIKHVWPSVNPVGHAREVLEQIEAKPPAAAAAR